MGCDIHLYCEGRINGKWINIDRWYRQTGWPEIAVAGKEGFAPVDLLDGARDYGLFYLLAGVRGSEEYNSYPPIAAPRGLPDEWDALLAEEYDFRDMPDNVNVHHVSHLTLKDLKESPYGKPMPLRGWVEEAEHEQMTRRMAAGEKVQLSFWDVKTGNGEERGRVLREWHGYINLTLISLIEQMEQLKKERRIGSDEEVRIVFWFDN